MKNFYILVFAILLYSFFGCKALGAQQKKIIVLGSSTAAGVGASPLDSTWVNRLRLMYLAKGEKVDVVNLAVGGFTTYNIMPSYTVSPKWRPAPDTLKNVTKAIASNPDLIIISLPTNDIAGGFSDTEILNNYSVILKEIADKGIQVLVTGTQPRNFPDINLRKRLKSFNAKMEQVYAGQYIDFYDDLANSEFSISDKVSFGDGLHVNTLGHRLIFNAFARSLFLIKWENGASSTSVLPISGLVASAISKPNFTMLKWKPLSAGSISYYSIYRSGTDKRSFIEIGRVYQKDPIKTNPSDYEFTDVFASEAISYYKVAAFNIQNELVASEILAVAGQSKKLEINLVRVSSESLEFELYGETSSTGYFIVSAISGQKLFERSLSPQNFGGNRFQVQGHMPDLIIVSLHTSEVHASKKYVIRY